MVGAGAGRALSFNGWFASLLFSLLDKRLPSTFGTHLHLLQSLDVSRCGFSEQGGTALFAALNVNHTLQAGGRQCLNCSHFFPKSS